MADFDYAEIAAVAASLVSDFGRDVTLVQLAVGPDDAQKPWRGTAAPRAAPLSTLTQRCVNVEPSSLERLGLLALSDEYVRRATKIVMFGGSTDLSAFQEVIDTGQRYRVLDRRELRPASLLLLTILVFER